LRDSRELGSLLVAPQRSQGESLFLPLHQHAGLQIWPARKYRERYGKTPQSERGQLQCAELALVA
jgi:hypothetical protein